MSLPQHFGNPLAQGGLTTISWKFQSSPANDDVQTPTYLTGVNGSVRGTTSGASLQALEYERLGQEVRHRAEAS